MIEMPSCREVPIGEILDRLVSMALIHLMGMLPLMKRTRLNDSAAVTIQLYQAGGA
jgi:hypothetical protein